MMKNETVIIYMVYINPNVNWEKLILTQLKDLARTQILSKADLHIVVSNPAQVPEVSIFFENLKKYYCYIEFHEENKFEYWAIHYLWTLSQKTEQYKYVVYFHTKGMSYARAKRNKVERVLTYYTFNYWHQCLRIFQEKPEINKIGLFPSYCTESQPHRGGWIWFNFWWARMEYIRHLEEPIDTSNRYYYEHWLSQTLDKSTNVMQDCYSLYGDDSARLYTANETGDLCTLLHRKQKNIFNKFHSLFIKI
ncbi:MAG: hypothetical protein QM666_04425 [Acinetobacter sp.]